MKELRVRTKGRRWKITGVDNKRTGAREGLKERKLQEGGK